MVSFLLSFESCWSKPHIRLSLKHTAGRTLAGSTLSISLSLRALSPQKLKHSNGSVTGSAHAFAPWCMTRLSLPFESLSPRMLPTSAGLDFFFLQPCLPVRWTPSRLSTLCSCVCCVLSLVVAIAFLVRWIFLPLGVVTLPSSLAGSLPSPSSLGGVVTLLAHRSPSQFIGWGVVTFSPQWLGGRYGFPCGCLASAGDVLPRSRGLSYDPCFFDPPLRPLSRPRQRTRFCPTRVRSFDYTHKQQAGSHTHTRLISTKQVSIT
jgi:hypothetical protein